MTGPGRAARRSPERIAAVGSAILMVVVGAVVVALRWEPSTAQAGVATAHVTSSARHRFVDLEGLVGASDLVVVGRVVADEDGRAFGDGKAAIRSHVLTVEVERVLGGGAAGSVAGSVAGPGSAVPEGTVVLVEEEHALADGTRLVVDGMRPGRVGDRGVWFLVAGGDPDFPAYALVNAQGRYLFAGRDALVVGDRSDALARRIEGLGRTTLESALLASMASLARPDR